MNFEYSDKMRNRRRHPELVLYNGTMHVFMGQSIPHVVRVISSKYEKCGDWSGTDYVLELPDGVVPVVVLTPFNGWGETWRDIEAELKPLSRSEIRNLGLLNERLKEAIRAADVNEIDIPSREWVIVTRHTGAIEWLRRHGIAGEVLDHVGSVDVNNKRVIGALPLHLAARALSVTTIDMPGLTPEQRGKDLSPEEMDAAGARLSTYKVVEINENSEGEL